MTEHPEVIFAIVIILVGYLALIFLNLWLFRLSAEKQKIMFKKVVRYSFKQLSTMLDDPEKFQTAKKTFWFLLIGSVSGAFLGGIGLLIFGLVGLNSGANAEQAKLYLLYIVVPFWFLANFLWLSFWILGIKVLNQIDRELQIGSYD